LRSKQTTVFFRQRRKECLRYFFHSFGRFFHRTQSTTLCTYSFVVPNIKI
jgi:hypothetical protein